MSRNSDTIPEEQIELLRQYISKAAAITRNTRAVVSQIAPLDNSRSPSPTLSASQNPFPYRVYTKPLKKGSPVPLKSSSSQYLVSNEQLFDQIQNIADLIQKHHRLVTEHSTEVNSQFEKRIVKLQNQLNLTKKPKSHFLHFQFWFGAICILLLANLTFVIYIAHKQRLI